MSPTKIILKSLLPLFGSPEKEKKIAIFHEPNGIDKYLMENKDIDIILHGHTHRFREEVINKVLIFNPGESAGMLKGKNAVGIVDLETLSTERIFF